MTIAPLDPRTRQLPGRTGTGELRIDKPGRRWIYEKAIAPVKQCCCPCCADMEIANRPTIKAGTPVTWEECLYLGIPPTGEVTA